MEMKIRKYRSPDRPSIVERMEELQDYLVAVDDLKRLRRMSEYGECFTQKLLEDIDKNDGLICLAEHEGQIVGFIAGIIQRQSKENLLECIPSKAGRILELFVDEQHREQKVGTLLMEKMEEYFRQGSPFLSKTRIPR